jgi:hypothetical protein
VAAFLASGPVVTADHTTHSLDTVKKAVADGTAGAAGGRWQAGGWQNKKPAGDSQPGRAEVAP